MSTPAPDTILGLPTLDPVLLQRHRGDVVVASAIQLLDLRGGPTEPIGVRAIGVDVPDDPRHALTRASAPALDVTATLDPRSGRPLDESPHAWACAIEPDTARHVAAIRRFARAREGVNRLGALERRGWAPGLLLARRQLFPLEPPRVVWLDGDA